MPPGNNLNDRIKMPSLKGVRYEILLSIFSATLFGGLSGEILDNTPYLQHAIPEGIGYIKSILSGEYISISKTIDSILPGETKQVEFEINPKLTLMKPITATLDIKINYIVK